MKTVVIDTNGNPIGGFAFPFGFAVAAKTWAAMDSRGEFVLFVEADFTQMMRAIPPHLLA